MSTAEILSDEDKKFMTLCEEELKYRYTDKDEQFMKVFNAEPSKPPIIESWWIPQNSGRRNDHRNNRRNNLYQRSGHRDREHQDRRDGHDRRGYSDYNQGYNRRYENRHQRPRY